MEALQARLEQLEATLCEKDAHIIELQSKVASLESNQNTTTNNNGGDNTFYITTAIHYTNGAPHVGHAYENITADAIARYHRAYGAQKVFFLTGTDEHGQKIAQTAEALNLPVKSLCDKYASVFEKFAHDLNLSHNNFIRTTSEEHKTLAQWAFNKALAAGDIYKGTYEGWYNVREETFVSETDAKAADYKDPTSNTPLKKMQEESYFFRMSKYQSRLIAHIEANPKFLQPESRRSLILKRLEEPLLDLSVSRNTFSHGIPLPNDDSHVMYVWFDALSNYLSGIGMPQKDCKEVWPANVHIIGKDILWFHAVIWPCMLMSIGLELPSCVFGHGFVNAGDGRKMSKSIGNVVDPYEMLERFNVDTLRYFICRATSYGTDMPFSTDDLINIHNAELADALGNLVHRAVNLCKKYCDGQIPSVKTDMVFNIDVLRTNVHTLMSVEGGFALQDVTVAVMNAVRDTNKYLTDSAPWHIKNDLKSQQVIVRSTLEAVYVCAIFLQPFIPSATDEIFKKLHTKPIVIKSLSAEFDNLEVGTTVDIGAVLFEKYLTDEEKAKAEAKTAVAPPKKKDVKKDVPLFAAMDIRVGVITNVWEHENSEKLFCEEIDVGNGEVKPIGSGLRAYYSLEEMKGRKVLVLLNLKPAKLGGFKSHGMVLCASLEDKVEFIEPPSDAVVGERVYIESQKDLCDPVSAGQMKKQKILEKASVDLKTIDGGLATYKGEVIQTSAGPCKAATLSNACIS